MTVKITDKKAPDALVVPLQQGDHLPDRLAEIALRAGADPSGLQNDFKAEKKEVFVLYAAGSPLRRFYLLGLGKKSAFPDMLAQLRSFSHRFKSKLPLKTGIDLRHFPESETARLTDAAVTGMLLGLYEINRFRSTAPEKPAPQFGSAKSELQVLVHTGALKSAAAAARRGEAFAAATQQQLDLMNAPANRKTPEMLVQWAREAGKAAGFKVRVLGKKEIVAEGLDALYAVGKGSPNDPALILLEYGIKTRKTKTPVIGLAGKGVTFDTGGISLKPSANMYLMKSDMGGASAVFGTFVMAARLQLPVRLLGAVPVAENAVDGLAVKPGDVIGSYSGKTIEVIDTDAEGRLILADAIAYLLKHEQPDALIDVATLTGSIIRAIGYHAGGLFTPNDELAGRLAAAGQACGERLWRMPMWEEYGVDLKSDIADLRNFTGKPMAESIAAAKFIEHFTAAHPAWAHLDIAGMAFADSEFAQGKSATGYGIRLLTEFIERYVETK
ncbi:MAG: leucyl aminopeptidase family protein [Lewinellaceae bacterium]|nr:leucyl aminopeptidase family protein [Lewinellaceae bacterium]